MTEWHKALYTFWSGFYCEGRVIAAYVSGEVPDSAVFPYITFEVKAGACFGVGLLTAIVWCKQESGESVHAQRAAILDSIAEAIPASGARLAHPGGMALLHRNTADFISYYDDPTDPTVKGGRVSYQIQYFNV